MNQQRGRLRASLSTALGLTWAAGPGLTIVLLGGAVLTGAVPVAAAWVLKMLVDPLASSEGTAAVAGPLIGLIGLAVLTLLLPAIARYTGAELERRVAVVVQRRLFERVNSMPGLRPFEDPSFHNTLRLAQQGGESAPPVVLSVGVGVVAELVTVAGFTGSLLLLSPLVAVLALAAAVPALVVQRRLSHRQADTAFTLSPHDRRRLFYGDLLVDQRAAQEIRLFGLGGFLLGRMLREYATINTGERSVDKAALRAQLWLGLLAGVLGAAGLLVVVQRAATGQAGVGDVVVAVAAVAGVQAAVTGIVASLGHVHEALLLLNHYRDLMDRETDLTTAGTLPCPPLRERIELRDVWFRYSPDHPWILRGLDLTLEAGQSLAVVGVNGAGKSTLVKLLCRLYDPDHGQVLWDGHDLRELDLESLRARTSTVFQKFMSYDLTAAENIGLGDVNRLEDRDAVTTAAQRAGAHTTLSELPRGYDTMLSRSFAGQQSDEAEVTEDGVDLSGGQWQRVALGRSLMRDRPDLVILDEPSSGLDARAEHEVHQSLLAHRGDRTSLLVSHRLSAVAMADQIVVIADGVVAESGSHAELVAADGEYARMFALQASGYLDPGRRDTTTPTISLSGTGPQVTESALDGASAVTKQ